MTTATMVSPAQTPKSVTEIIPTPTTEEIGTMIDEEEDDEDLSEKTITAIVEKAVKSAKEAVTTEINSYQEEINKLQAELATAKSKAVSGGPKRSGVKIDMSEVSELLNKAAEFRAKASVTADKDLARGYRELAADFDAKANATKPSN
jgi:Skp family chaperone for outer membrane proteins